MKKIICVFIACLMMSMCITSNAAESIDGGVLYDFTDEFSEAYSSIGSFSGCAFEYSKAEEALLMAVSSTDPNCRISNYGRLQLSDYPYFVIVLKNLSSGVNFEMYLATTETGESVKDQSTNIMADITPNDTEFQTYIWNFGQEFPSVWHGILTDWRFDGLQDCMAGDSLYIKYIGFFKTEDEARDALSAADATTCEATTPEAPETTAPESILETTPEASGNTTVVDETVPETDAQTDAETTGAAADDTESGGGNTVILICGASIIVLLFASVIILVLKKKSVKITAVLLAVTLAATLASLLLLYFNSDGAKSVPGGETNQTETGTEVKEMKYTGKIVSENGDLAGVDALGRIIPQDVSVTGGEGKQVGVFYFLCTGNYNPLYDNTVTIENDPTAYESNAKWTAAGGAPVGTSAYWGKPLFGYYKDDEWVMRKHAQLLAAAGVDYIVFDATNGYEYNASALKVFKVFKELYDEGIAVPKIAYYTNTNSGAAVARLYETIYKKYDSQYGELWFRWDGKPLIIAHSSDNEITNEMRDYFTIKESVWPTETLSKKQSNNGFPWMEFSRLYTDGAIYGKGDRREVVSVSAAQHCDTVMFSYTAWYGGNDHTRSWHDGENDASDDAALYGYNFAEQWEWAIEQNPETIFVTGFNEFSAVRLNYYGEGNEKIQFCDCCDENCSRDIEPSVGALGDNYFMQLAYYIRLYKGSAGRVDTGVMKSVDVNGGFSQFDGASAVYTDSVNDTVDRDYFGCGDEYYTDKSGRNNIEKIKVLYDSEYLYYYIKTAANLTDPADEGWMTLFIDAKSGGAAWEGYDFVVNRTAPENGKTSVERCDADGEYSWEKVADAEIRWEEDGLILKIPRSALGHTGKTVDVRFKVADNYIPGDVYSFYTSGDCAPIGRFNSVFSNKQSEG